MTWARATPAPPARPAVWSDESGPAGAPLVATVHGTMDRSASMVKLSRLLADRYRVLRFDRRGYGRSKPHDGPFDMEGNVADLIGLLAGRRAVLLGHSFGGNVALAVAARRPELVRGVVAYEPPLSWFEWWPGTSRALRDSPAPPDVAAERFMRRVAGEAQWAALSPAVQAQRRAEGVVLVAELTDLATTPPWKATDVVGPVITVSGENGAAHHRAAARQLAEMLPHARHVELAGANHNGHWSHPAELAALLDELGSATAD